MSTVNTKLSERSAATTTTGGYYHIILPSGAIFVSRKISDADIIKAHNADRLYSLVFDTGDLSSGTTLAGTTSDGYLDVNHNKGSETIQVTIKDPNNKIYTGHSVEVYNENRIQIDFGGAIAAGNWKLELFAYLT